MDVDCRSGYGPLFVQVIFHLLLVLRSSKALNIKSQMMKRFSPQHFDPEVMWVPDSQRTHGISFKTNSKWAWELARSRTLGFRRGTCHRGQDPVSEVPATDLKNILQKKRIGQKKTSLERHRNQSRVSGDVRSKTKSYRKSAS